MIIETGIVLRCGCCGMDFVTWDGYVDQDQDHEFGICAECQNDAVGRMDVFHEEIIALVKSKLSLVNLEKFNKKDFAWQKGFALRLWNEGKITFSFKSYY